MGSENVHGTLIIGNLEIWDIWLYWALGIGKFIDRLIGILRPWPVKTFSKDRTSLEILLSEPEIRSLFGPKSYHQSIGGAGTECQETECQGDQVPRDWVPRDWVPRRLSAKETDCQERLSAKWDWVPRRLKPKVFNAFCPITGMTYTKYETLAGT